MNVRPPHKKSKIELAFDEAIARGIIEMRNRPNRTHASTPPTSIRELTLVPRG